MSGAETIHSDMRAAFRQTLLGISGLPASFAWEGREFRPVIGTPYIREAFRPIYSTVRALGAGGTIEHRMTGNLVLRYPAGGIFEIERCAGLILKTFRPGLSLVYGGSSGFVMSAERAGLMSDPDWVSCPVTITVSAHTVN